MKPKKFVAALVALSLVFCLVPARAFAYVDYSGDQALTQVSAVYQYLKEYGGASDLPDADDTAAAEFYANILGQTATPFYSFLYNYSYYALFSGWRVYQASDFADNDDAQWRYQESMDAAVEYLLHEWAAWVEEYPGAGGSSSGPEEGPIAGLPTGVGVIYAEHLQYGSYAFADGTTLTPASSEYVDFYNTASDAGCPVFIFNTGSTPYLNNIFAATAERNSLVAPSSDVGMAFASPSLARKFSFSTNKTYEFFSLLSSNSTTYFWRTIDNSLLSRPDSLVSSIAAVETRPMYGPDDYYYSYIGTSGIQSAYVITNSRVWFYGNWYGAQIGPSIPPDSPTGPTAPDYETPEPFQPVNPTLPNITNNITNNPSSYTGSETDYSEYLKIIIDNQKQQIQQLHDFGELIDREWDGFTNWLNTELDNVLGYLYNYQQFWNTLLEYQKSANGYLYSIDQQILKLRNRLSNDANMLWGLLRDIYYKIPSDGGGTLPDVTIDDGDGGGFLNWLYDLIDQAVDLLVGGSAELTGMLDDLRQLTGVFPFSLPWDLIAVLTVLQHEPVGDLTLEYPIIDGVAEGGGVSWTWHELDLTFAQPLIVACNFGFFGLALLGLIHATKDMFEMVNKVVG